MTSEDVTIAAKGLFVVGVCGVLANRFLASAMIEPTLTNVSLNGCGILGAACVSYLGAMNVRAAFRS